MPEESNSNPDLSKKNYVTNKDNPKFSNAGQTFVIRPWTDNSFISEEFRKKWEEELGLPQIDEYNYLLQGEPLYTELIEKISNASIIIIDLSWGLTNVYFEYGIALTLKKPIIIFNRNQEQNSNLLKTLLDEISKMKDELYKDKFTEITKRYFGMGSDVAGIITLNNFSQLEKQVTKTIKSITKKPQYSSINEFQLEEYLKVVQESKEYDKITLYFNYMANDKIVEDLYNKYLEKLIENNQLTIDKCYVHFEIDLIDDNTLANSSKEIEIPIYEDFFKKLIYKDQFDFYLTIHNLKCRLLLIGKDFIFHFIDNGQYIFEKLTNTNKTDSLRNILDGSSVRVDTFTILKSLIKIKDHLNINNIKIIDKKGFSFYTYSGLWFTPQIDILNCFTSINSEVAKLKNIIDDHVTYNFEKFFFEYKEHVKLIIAVWPLSFSSISLGTNQNVRNWISTSKIWYKKKTTEKTKENLIRRYFIVPPKYSILNLDEERIMIDISKNENMEYLKLILRFFYDDFKYQECPYLDHCYVLLQSKELLIDIFGEVSQIFDLNTILFSQNNYDDLYHDNYYKLPSKGIIQTELPIPIDATQQEIFNLHYSFVSRNQNGNLEIKKTVKHLMQLELYRLSPNKKFDTFNFIPLELFLKTIKSCLDNNENFIYPT
ncbi:MAG: hypothetical protein A2315_04980 [Ignavibacteria bacterium RIFOXYB2_FULL_35_12]|nr:MAG: hypothetical protein A2058_12505 [Ignavibacteria bacterium GWA2_36_19]OGU60786.1 MAG: hypothetical protein A2X60_09625 [Ignavibacteria bacterium GWF2_35_20]OGU83093.1 MAG: hypothetical protein A2254_08595 [Ignavibacteria bacterium RIFOXYA2_FULL_35_9]OGU84174.1 MAG: hypothetical protein A3K31_03225 [Ignavibacteria bacterium RIFOXYA12_FULL_35_25]OGU97324.1 MAG: hypothetical protein A2347_06640 [Ignavibacteria bacterium RIFOXYB12_FULL_35_14]OGU99503.1 MAG: hypothetical protein A2455_05740